MTTASVVGIPSKTSWSTTANIRLSSAELWCACGFSGSEESPHVGRHFITFLENLPVTSEQEVYQHISEYLGQVSPSTAFSIAVAFRTKTSVLLMTFGYAILAFYRKGQGLRWLMDGSQPQQVLQGSVVPGDTLFLATARFSEMNFPLETYIHLPMNDLSADLFPRVQGHKNSGEIAALFVRSRVLGASTSKPDDALHKSTEPTKAPTPPSRTSATPASSHLISPERIQAGVVAAQVSDVPRRIPEKVSQQIWNRVQDFNWRQLHLIRIVAVVVIVVGVIGGMAWYRAMNVSREYESVIVPLETLAAEVASEQDTFAQRNAAESLLERLEATRLSYTANRRRLTELQSVVESVFNEVSGQKNIVNLPVFYDFRLISPEFLATKVTRERNRAFFLDATRSQVISLDLISKQNETIPLQDIAQPLDMTSIGSRLFFLTASGVQSSTLSGADVQTAVGFDEDIEDPTYLSSFGENLYVLDRGVQQIWRADGTAQNASPSGWVRSAAGVDFSTVSSMAINGSIWLGSNSGDVYELLAGARENFQFIGLPDPFTSSLLVAANPEGEKLVVIEPSRQKLVVFQKDTGAYEKQITSEQLGAVTDVVMNEDETLVFLLAGSVVYRIEIE